LGSIAAVDSQNSPQSFTGTFFNHAPGCALLPFANQTVKTGYDEMILTFDIGGTYLRAGAYDSTLDRLVARCQCRAPSFKLFPDLGEKRLRKKLYEQMKVLSHDVGLPHPKSVGIAFPGPIEHGNALQAPTLWGDGIKAEPVAENVKEIWPDCSVDVFNDLTAAGYSLMKKKDEDLCVITVSSGIGHKVFVGGRPVLGPRCRGGEIGHWRVEWADDAPFCDCGGIGHLGAVSSGRATGWQIQRLYQKNPSAYAASVHRATEPDRLTNTDIVVAFRDGDAWTRTLIENMVKPLGQALALIHLSVGSEKFVVIGGFANALGPDYVELLETATEAAAWEPGICRGWTFELGKTGNDAGLLGSGKMVSRSIRGM
jgi:glucokinase